MAAVGLGLPPAGVTTPARCLLDGAAAAPLPRRAVAALRQALADRPAERFESARGFVADPCDERMRGGFGAEEGFGQCRCCRRPPRLSLSAVRRCAWPPTQVCLGRTRVNHLHHLRPT